MAGADRIRKMARQIRIRVAVRHYLLWYLLSVPQIRLAYLLPYIRSICSRARLLRAKSGRAMDA